MTSDQSATHDEGDARRQTYSPAQRLAIALGTAPPAPDDDQSPGTDGDPVVS